MKLKLWHTALRPQYESKIHPTTFQVLNQWIKLNTNLEIQRVIADDNFCTSFLEQFDKLYETETLKLYNSEEDGRFKSDLFRLCVLLQEGGMYVDVDQLPLVEISKFLDLEKIDFCTGVLAPHNYICNGILYAKNPNNKIIRACLDYHIHVYGLKAQGKHEGDMSAIHTMCKTIRDMCENKHIQENEMTIGDYKCLFLQEIEGDNTFLNSFRYKKEPIMMTRYYNYHRDKISKHEHIPYTVKQDFNVK